MVGLPRGTRVTVNLAKGPRQGQLLDERPGFYQCHFDDGATAWVDQRDVEATSGGGGFAPPPNAPQPGAAVFAPPAGSYGAPGMAYPCVVCGRPGSDYFPTSPGPMHRSCSNLGPDVLSTTWIVLTYLVLVPIGCSIPGILFGSLPYYAWRKDYPNKAKTFNKHTWIAVGCCLLLWITIGTLVNVLAPATPPHAPPP